MIDLHTHSNASDGTYTPKELVKFAESLGIRHLALTDHDTTFGVDELLSVNTDIELIPGIEISVDHPNGELHIVGLFIDKSNSKMRELEDSVKFFRQNRNKLMLEKLSLFMKKNIKQEDLVENKDCQLGRPHIAKYLVKNGIAESSQDAFDRFLSDGLPLCVSKKKVDISDAIDVIKSSGGVVVLAHPSTLKLDDEELSELVKRYADIGLDCLEVFSSHTPIEKQETYYNIAKKHNLAVSAGSDFHGANSKILQLGAKIGELDYKKIISDIKSRL